MRWKTVQCLTVLADNNMDADVIEAIGSQRKLVGEGTCMEFYRKELDEVLERHSETLSREQGRTNLVEFAIDTGEATPIQQRPYRQCCQP